MRRLAAIVPLPRSTWCSMAVVWRRTVYDVDVRTSMTEEEPSNGESTVQ
jgi:hypothetical protein